MTFHLENFLTGLLVSASLIIAIGSQNAFLLKSALRNHYAFWVATLCFMGDFLLINAGAFGLAALFKDNVILNNILLISGFLFLSWYGLNSLRSAWKGYSQLHLGEAETAKNFAKVTAMTLAMTFLNPHVYLDTVVLIGGITIKLNFDEKISFVIGALLSSAIWFYSLAFLSRKLAHLLTTPKAWRIIDSFIGIFMIAIAFKLIFDFSAE